MMMTATTPLFKPLSITTSFFTINSSSFSSKPTNFFPRLSWKLSLRKTILTMVASQEENQVVLEDEEEEEESGGDYYPEPTEDAKLFVGNLPYDLDSERLAMLFEKAGIVHSAEVIYNRDTDQSRGFGFVTMTTVDEAEKAIDMFNRYDINGRNLTVNKAAPKGSRPERTPRSFEPSFRIYVGNLPWQVDDARLEQVFSEYGKVADARVVYDRESGRSRGFGFITMSTQTEVDDAIAALDGQEFDPYMRSNG
ncbi:hypothetical protein IFM89_033799 [Coptis chinensis]|uniref:RRM domain-containing protein n=1 Tax=Coptis chinensis TaxID=261450 RepID=A0A835HPC5_9MAGN|nr:hypothetical protein IFM89_033799 [Coptis chinensis]